MLRALWQAVPHERQRLLVAMTVFACVVFLLDRVGNAWQLYHSDYFGYDKGVHFAAGAFCGTFSLWLFQPTGEMRELRYALMAAFVVSFWVGFGWEVYEVAYGEADLGTFLYWGDTVFDIIADIAGGVTAALVCREKK